MSAAGFQASGPACCDGRWMVDGGGWSKKKFSDFAQNFFRWSSGDINVPPFRFLWRHVFKWKKIRFEVRNFWNFSPNSPWVIGVFLQVWIFSWGLTWHFFRNHSPKAENHEVILWRLQNSDALFGRITILTSFIKNFPSLARSAFLAESKKPCSVCVKRSVLWGFVC